MLEREIVCLRRQQYHKEAFFSSKYDLLRRVHPQRGYTIFHWRGKNIAPLDTAVREGLLNWYIGGARTRMVITLTKKGRLVKSRLTKC